MRPSPLRLSCRCASEVQSVGRDEVHSAIDFVADQLGQLQCGPALLQLAAPARPAKIMLPFSHPTCHWVTKPRQATPQAVDISCQWLDSRRLFLVASLQYCEIWPS